MHIFFKLLLLPFFVFFLVGMGRIISQPVQHRDIQYLSDMHPAFNGERHLLDIYVPEKLEGKTEVVIFIHGGKWKVGDKKIYRFLGKKMAKHNVVTVVINYRLSSVAVNYSDMAMDCAYAAKWVYEHIEHYGGNKNRIFLYGHSSGAHLCALIASNDRFFDSTGTIVPLKGCVLIDPFGLNIDRYLKEPPRKDRWLYEVFTRDSLCWKDATPSNYIKADSAKYMVFVGSNSPEKIQRDGEIFFEKVYAQHTTIHFSRLYNAGHLTILFQLYYTRHRVYKRFIRFMDS